MKSILRIVDAISDWGGKIVRWFAITLVAVVTYAVIMRYIFHVQTLWTYELLLMMGASLYALGFGYAQRHRAHIRVDIFYARLSPRGRAIIDVLGGLLIFLPLSIALIYASASWAGHAWVIDERMPLTGWYPPIAPLRTVVAIGFCVLALQGMAQLIRDLYFLIRNKPYD